MEAVSNSQKDALDTLRVVLTPKIKNEAGEVGERVISHVDEGYTQVVRSVQDADQVKIGEKNYDKDDIARIARIEEPVKDVAEHLDVFLIEGIRKNQGHLNVNVVNYKKDLSFTIKVDISFTPKDELDAFYNALRDETTLPISYQAHYRDGEIAKARLIRVQPDSSLASVGDAETSPTL